MYVHLEKTQTIRSDCTINSASWMGKVPDVNPIESGGWKLNRLNYYQEGWLATGNSRGIVGVTFTACHCKKNFEAPSRMNFNLRGHRSEVALVKWNEPYQKLATCDVTGVIFVWIRHEGRWSIELINDRNSQVTDFSWSHDGRMALICYRDGFVLVGSVAGQRYWSSMLNLESSTITCGVWSPDDQKVLFGTTDGQIIVMSSAGTLITQVYLSEGQEISNIVLSCEKFYLNEQEAEAAYGENGESIMVVSFRNGAMCFMNSYDDPCPKIIQSYLTGLKLEWSNDGQLLAAAGFRRLSNLDCENELRFYTREAALRFKLLVPQQTRPITCVTWGHNDNRLFIAAGTHIYTFWVTKKMCLLQNLCRRSIQMCVKDERTLTQLPLPPRLRSYISALYLPTVKGYTPQPLKLREFVCVPPVSRERLFCTMIKHGEETSGGHYMLYLEYLGGLIPLLKGKRASKLRPEFVVFDPKIKNAAKSDPEDNTYFLSSESSSDNSDVEVDFSLDGCHGLSPRLPRRRRMKKQVDLTDRRDSNPGCRTMDELLYDDNLPETHRLVEITSNLWGTKFKIHGLASFLHEDLGHVHYKTSLLHLQPRQMTVTITELTEDFRPHPRDPSYNPNQFSESEDELGTSGTPKQGSSSTACVQTDQLPPISPEAAPVKHPFHAITHVACGTVDCPLIVQNVHGKLQRNGKSPKSPKPNGKFHCMCDRICQVHEKLSDRTNTCGSTSQRKSPRMRSRSLSPSEQCLSLQNSDEQRKENGKSPSRPCHFGTDVKTDFSSKSDHNLPPLSIMQLAARKLENSMRKLNAAETESSAFESKSDTCLLNKSENLALKPNCTLNEDDNNTHACCSCTCSVTSQISPSTVPSSSGFNCNPSASNINIEPSNARVVLSKQSKSHCKKRAKNCEVNCYNIRNSSNSKCVEVSMKDQARISYPIGSLEELYSGGSSADSTPSNSRPNSPSRLSNKLKSKHISRFEMQQDSDPESTRKRTSSGTRLRRFFSRKSSERQSASVPTSPVRQIISPKQEPPSRDGIQDPQSAKTKTHHLRKKRLRSRSKNLESSDDEYVQSGGEQDITTSENYKNLETFQKAQLSKKLRKVRTQGDYELIPATRGRHCSPSPHRSPSITRKSRNFVMHNKAPLWNEHSQVYQLDFGGRVTQESAKNFQIDFKGKQVMQFGRIDSNAYTLDFEYPFTAVQAFAVALANVTQRLK